MLRSGLIASYQISLVMFLLCLALGFVVGKFDAKLSDNWRHIVILGFVFSGLTFVSGTVHYIHSLLN